MSKPNKIREILGIKSLQFCKYKFDMTNALEFINGALQFSLHLGITQNNSHKPGNHGMVENRGFTPIDSH